MRSVNSSAARNVGARRRETSGATTTITSATITTLRSIARVEAVPQLAHSLLSSKEHGDLVHPLPREFNIVDPSRDAGDYLIPVSVDDDLHVLVPEGDSATLKSHDDVHLVSRASQHRHPTERHQLKEFETVEALLRDASMAEVNNIHSQGDDSDIDSNEDDDNEQIHVLKELNALGSRIDAARRANSQHLSSHTAPPASTSYTASSYQSEQQAPTPSALFLLEKEASSLISFSLSNPKMQMYAREVAKRQTTAEVSQPHHAGAAGGDLAKETVTTTTTKAVHHAHQHSSSAAPDIAAPPPQDSSQNSTTVAAAAILTGMNTNLSQAIANQQVALERALEEHRKKQEATLLVHREAMGQAQADAQSKANAALKHEINTLKRQQQELLRQQKELELERRHEGSGGRPVGLAAPSSITVDGGHHHHHHQKPAATDLATNAIVRNIPQETASLIANALQSERTKMADERRQWERTMQEVQEGAAAQQQALLKQMKVLSGQQEAAVQQAAAHALRKAQTTHEKHAERIAKLMELQQRQHVHDLRVDNSLSRQQQQQQATTATKRPGSLTVSSSPVPANAVAAEIQAKKDQLASSKSAVSFDLPEGSDSSPAALQTILLDTTGSEVQASDLLSTTPRRQMSEAAAGTGHMRLGAILARKAKPTKAVITPSPASPIPKKEDLSATTHQQDSGAAHSKSRRSKTGTAPGSPSATSNSSSSPIPVTTEEDTTKETHRKDDSDAVPTNRDKVASFLNQATKALVDGGAVADVFLQSGSEANSPIPLIILTDAQGLAVESGGGPEHGAEHEPVQCVEMCVAMFMSEDRAADLVGASKRTARDPLSAAPRLLTKEEAELLIDARRRLQRIQAFSIDFSSPNRRDNDNQQEGEEEVIPCFVGEEADALLLNVITKKLVHEVLAENIRGFLHDFERSHQGDGSSEETSGDAKVHLFPSTGSQGLDRLVLEECLQEYLNTPALVNEIHVRNASTAPFVDTSPVTTQQQQRASKLPVGVVELLRLNATKQNEVLEQALWQEWMLVQADMLREKNELSAEAQKAVRVPVTGDESHPTWLTDNSPLQSTTQPLALHQQQQQAAPVVNVVVDTSSIADLLRNWGRNLAPSSFSEGIPPGTSTSLPSSTSAASPKYLQQEASRHPQLDEELPTTSDRPLWDRRQATRQ
ncbi:Hypothetical protein, putative [Bodo saltans]|uniref:Uncharacterized protein n=1 Tax=Bodo saltans TaxID=75058 RepID=A0A0S4J5M6_BODSA|nr:Hypothetical protein, putative [Bodo saltans]|eukprot:CUG86473.1 Hypothetical protein, putative [Bodo saltans]